MESSTSLPAPFSHRVGISYSNAVSSRTGKEAWWCLIILATFWFFLYMTLILGLYGAEELVLGPNCSWPLQANSMFVQDIKVQGDNVSTNGPMLYGFLQPPPLDVKSTWLASRYESIQANKHKTWIHNLNEGAKIHISYDIVSQVFYPLILVIAQGRENLNQWIEDPSRPNITFSWNIIHGNGTVEQSITNPSDYYTAIWNPNHIDIEVILDFHIQNIVYNTTGAYYKCELTHKMCAMKQLFGEANFGVLTTPTGQANGSDEWYVRVSYAPRWITYFLGSGVLTAIMLLLYYIFKDFCSVERNVPSGTTEATRERTPLLGNKDDDHMSLGSSYESVSHDEEDDGEFLDELTNVLKNDDLNNTQQLCTICCDARRDCFFLPCGHCAVCFTCGTRILDEAGNCPICRRKMKKVRKIFAV